MKRFERGMSFLLTVGGLSCLWKGVPLGEMLGMVLGGVCLFLAGTLWQEAELEVHEYEFLSSIGKVKKEEEE